MILETPTDISADYHHSPKDIMTIIVYNSKTGSSEKYARLLSERTGFDCYSVKDSYPKDEDIVFFGWLRKYTIVGMSKVDVNRVKAVCAVGCDNVDFFNKEEVVSCNGYSAETFYLRGWIIPEKLNFIERLILKLVSKKILKEAGEYADMTLITAMNKGGDFFDESFIDPVVEFLKG